MASGIATAVTVSPQNENLGSKQATLSVPAGTTRIINVVEEFRMLGSGYRIDNLDGTNVASFRIDGPSSQLLNIPTADFYAASGFWFEQLEIIAGAIGDCRVIVVGTPINEVL